MKFFNIMLMIFLFNIAANTLGVFFSDSTIGVNLNMTISPVAGLGVEQVEAEQNSALAQLNSTQKNILDKISDYGDTVRLFINGLTMFARIFINSSVYTKATYKQLLCGWGITCASGSTLDTFINLMWLATSFFYVIGIFQLFAGRSLKEVE